MTLYPVKATPSAVIQHIHVALITKYAHYKINLRTIIFRGSHNGHVYSFCHDNNYIYKLGEIGVLHYVGQIYVVLNLYMYCFWLLVS